MLQIGAMIILTQTGVKQNTYYLGPVVFCSVLARMWPLTRGNKVQRGTPTSGRVWAHLLEHQKGISVPGVLKLLNYVNTNILDLYPMKFDMSLE